MWAGLAEAELDDAGCALYNVALDAVFVSIFATVGILIFWRRSDDAMALLVATMLVTWGSMNGLLVQTTEAIEVIRSMFEVLSELLGYGGYMAWMLFFYLFPSVLHAAADPRYTAPHPVVAKGDFGQPPLEVNRVG